MLACNETVADALAKRGAPALFRVHEDPDPEKLEALRPLLNALGLGAESRGDLTDPFVLQALLERAQNHRASKLVAYLVLRAMAQARYSEELQPHYGLGFKAYCHFTSPIRRYPDLIVHRSLAAALWGGPGAPEGLSELASHCSRTERASDQAEREVLAWYQIAFLADRLGDEFQAMILGFTRFGARIELLDHLIEGVCPFHAMASDYMTVDRDGLAARGRYSGAVLKVGDLVEAKLVRVDRLAGEAQFALDELPPGREAGRGKKRRRC
jgi:ribonuclease R